MSDRFEIIRDDEEPPTSSSSGQIVSPKQGNRFEIVHEKPDLPTAYIGKTPEQIEQMKARDDRQAQSSFDKMMLSGKTPQDAQKIAGAHSFGESTLPGVFDYIPAAGARALGELGIPGYEGYKGKPVFGIKEQSRQMGEAAARRNPKTATAGDVAGIVGGISTMPAVTRLPGLGKLGTVGSGAATGALYGGVSEGAREGDIGSAAKGAGFGTALGATVSPVVERALGSFGRLAFGGKPVTDPSTGLLTKEAFDIARDAGLTHQQIADIHPELVDTFTQRGLTKEAAREAPFREFGITPTRGMVSHEPKQLSREAAFADYAPVSQQATEGAENVVGGPQLPLRDAVEAAAQKGVQNAAALKRSYENAYRRASSAPGDFDLGSITNVGDTLLAKMAADPSALALRNNELVVKAAGKLNSDLGTALPIGTGPNPPTVVYRNFRAVEEARKGLNEFLSAAQNKTDRAGIRRLVDEFDQHVEDSIVNGAFSGDPRVAQQWRNARALFQQYQAKYGVKKSGLMSGKLMNDIIQNNRTPDEVGSMLFNFSGTGDATAKATALKTFAQLKRALGPNAPEIDAIKQSFLQQLMTPNTTGQRQPSPALFADTARRVEAFLQGNQATFARGVLSPSERAMLSRYAEVMRMASVKAPKDVEPMIGKFGQAVSVAAPIVGNAALSALGYIHPSAAAVFGLLSGIGSRTLAMKESEILARRAAGAPLKNVPRNYQLPGVRTGIPLLDQTYERTARASGGRTMRKAHTAQSLIAAVKRAKKDIESQTETILAQPDEHVVKALAVASKNI